MSKQKTDARQGQEFDKEGNLIFPFTQYYASHNKLTTDGVHGDAMTDITVIDRESALVRVYSNPTTSGISFSFPGVTNVSLPLVLLGVSVTYNSMAGNGEDLREIGGAHWEGDSGGFSLTPNARATGTASIMPDIVLDIAEPRGTNVPTINYVFYMSSPFTADEVVAQLTSILTKTTTGVVSGVVNVTAGHGLVANQPFRFVTVVGGLGGITAGVTYYVKTVISTTQFSYSATAGGAAITTHDANSGTTFAALVQTWPVFRPVAHTFTLKGQQISVSQNAESLFQYRWSPGNISFMVAPYGGSRSDGYSKENGVTVRSVRTPAVIHGAISLTGGVSEQAIAATHVKANTPAVTGIGSAPSFSGLTNEPAPVTGIATASVTPAALSATEGVTSIPTNGLYISDIRASPYRFNTVQIRVELVNFNHFA